MSHRRNVFALTTGLLATILLTGCSLLSGSADKTAPSPAQVGAVEDPKLIWREDFNAGADSPIDAKHMSYDEGAGWDSSELQTFTRAPANSALSGDGALRISAVKNLNDNTFTSARVSTRNLVAITQGTLQARIKLPARKGVLASFSLVATNVGDVKKPSVAEIDIAQVSGDGKTVYTALLGPKTGQAGQRWRVGTSFAQPVAVDAQFHTFGIQKTPASLTFAIDNKVSAVVKPSDLPAGTDWVFDQPFFIVLSVSVGGDVVGPPDPATVFPADMYIDWISLSAIVIG